MAETFIDDSFLLPGRSAQRLYHEYAAKMPIYDYYSHLPVRQILDDVTFSNLTQVWLYGDQQKWRAMRTCGVAEDLCSGTPAAGDDYSRFAAWAGVAPQTLGNPLYHWSHLELKRYFGVNKLLSPVTAREIYDVCGEMLASPDFSTRALIRRSNVDIVCVTEDPAADLADYGALAAQPWATRVRPVWNPDKALAARDASALNLWVDKLERRADMAIVSCRDLRDALWKRHQIFHSAGCRLSDYNLERPYVTPCTDAQLEAAFARLRAGVSLGGEELEVYRSGLLFELLTMDAEQDWAQQLHFGAKRNNGTRAYQLRGPGADHDCIGDFSIGDALVELLDRLDSSGRLTRAVVYVLNPADNDMIVSILGSYQADVPGRMQFGPAWWHNVHKQGLLRHLHALSGLGLISRFVGMVTDSGSFLAYPRHEYFRRILCAKLGADMDNGEMPMEFELVGAMVKDICYNNAERYFAM
jgi:glucuronate isomerase